MDESYQNDFMVTFRDLALTTQVEDDISKNKQVGNDYALAVFNKLFPTFTLNIGNDGFNRAILRFLDSHVNGGGGYLFDEDFITGLHFPVIVFTTIRKRLYLNGKSTRFYSSIADVNEKLYSFKNMTQLHVTIKPVLKNGRGSLQDIELKVAVNDGVLNVERIDLFTMWDMRKVS